MRQASLEREQHFAEEEARCEEDGGLKVKRRLVKPARKLPEHTERIQAMSALYGSDDGLRSHSTNVKP